MKNASVSELKAGLSRYLDMVRRGSEVQILERGVPIARLVGLSRAPAGDDQRKIDRLVKAGVVRRGAGSLRWVLKEPPVVAAKAKLREALATDREDRL
jgi:prevent-host-death family protein